MDKADLLRRRILEAEVKIGDVGAVTVRGLSRGEVFDLRAKDYENLADLEIATITLCLVDPVMSADEVRQWYYAAPSGELEAVFTKIREISGLDEGAQKSNGTSPDAR